MPIARAAMKYEDGIVSAIWIFTLGGRLEIKSKNLSADIFPALKKGARSVLMSDRRWRRTALTRADGRPVPDDWSLVDEQLGPVARIYKETGGPRDGQWFWTVLVDGLGRPWNGGTGHCATGAEAKTECDKRLSR